MDPNVIYGSVRAENKRLGLDLIAYIEVSVGTITGLTLHIFS